MTFPACGEGNEVNFALTMSTGTKRNSHQAKLEKMKGNKKRRETEMSKRLGGVLRAAPPYNSERYEGIVESWQAGKPHPYPFRRSILRGGTDLGSCIMKSSLGRRISSTSSPLLLRMTEAVKVGDSP